jgi:peroxidase
MQNKGLLQSDQVLFNGGSTDSIVSEYSRNPARFSSDFGSVKIAKFSEARREMKRSRENFC